MKNWNYLKQQELTLTELKEIQGGFSPIWLPVIVIKIVEEYRKKLPVQK